MRGGKISLLMIILLVLAGVVLLLGTYTYFSFFHFSDGVPRGFKSAIGSPIVDMSDAEAIEQFDESYVEYLLYEMKAFNLHSPPFSGNTPKMEFHIDGVVYSVEVTDDEFVVEEAEVVGEDLVITTTKEDVVAMIRGQNGIKSSFEDGGSSVEVIADKDELFWKGYLKIYDQFAG